MTKRPFGRTGFDVTPLGFGAGPIGYLKIDHQHIAVILNLLLDGGINVIDTAGSYPGSEEVIGDTVGHRRDQFRASACSRPYHLLALALHRWFQ
jgi:aryl-alcohol dehydrogenase-like predicted oxidoreductase